MSDTKKAVSSQKSGVSNVQYVKVLGGIPDKKTVEQIEKVNTPGKAPGSAKD